MEREEPWKCSTRGSGPATTPQLLRAFRPFEASSVARRDPLRDVRVCASRPREIVAPRVARSPRSYPRSLDALRGPSRHGASLRRRQLALGHVDAAVWTWRDCWPFASYINLSARWINSAASLRATPRRSATGPSRRQTTPTSTFTGRDASRRSSRDQSWPSTEVLKRSAISIASAHPGRSGIRKQNSSPPKRACRSRASLRVRGEEVLRADLIGENPRDALDDAIADRVTERVVVPLEAGDVDDADRAPPDALLDRQKRLDPLHEPVEVEELRLGIPMGFFGEIGDDFLEVAGDVADGDVLLADLPLQPIHLAGEAFGERANRVVLRFLEELPLASDDLLDFLKELRLADPDRASSWS